MRNGKSEETCAIVKRQTKTKYSRVNFTSREKKDKRFLIDITLKPIGISFSSDWWKMRQK